ncbi:MAG: hypothetical protein MMC23_000938 [Stictis urceolatum]|nr:hypothetical protein [Stictis urceolata]
MRAFAKPLPPITDGSFAPHFDFLASSRIVLLGDASHGTSEFYHARAEMTKYLVEEYGFTAIALEADWPDAEALDRYVRQRPGNQTKLSETESADVSFKRFPTWMWRNKEMQDLVHFLRDRNATKPETERAGAFGLDLYSLGGSIDAIIKYLDQNDPTMAKEARQRYAELEEFRDQP